jgi:amino acid transporter
MITEDYLFVAFVTTMVVLFAAFVHYEGLRFLTDRLPEPRQDHRRRVLLMILLLLLLHVVQIWIFGITYRWLVGLGDYGTLEGLDSVTLIDSIYFSAMVYTTIGFGDIYPSGPLRLMVGMEGITGLTMITWSASFTFIEMGKDWKKHG